MEELIATLNFWRRVAGGLGVFEPRDAAKKYPRQDPLKLSEKNDRGIKGRGPATYEQKL